MDDSWTFLLTFGVHLRRFSCVKLQDRYHRMGSNIFYHNKHFCKKPPNLFKRSLALLMGAKEPSFVTNSTLRFLIALLQTEQRKRKRNGQGRFAIIPELGKTIVNLLLAATGTFLPNLSFAHRTGCLILVRTVSFVRSKG